MIVGVGGLGPVSMRHFIKLRAGRKEMEFALSSCLLPLLNFGAFEVVSRYHQSLKGTFFLGPECP